MFGTIRKHQRWLWVLIIAAVIISFVAFFSPNQGGGRGGGSSVIGMLDGKPVSDTEVRDQLRLAELSGFLRYGQNYRSAQAQRMGFSLKQALAQRMLIESRRKAYGIEVSDEAVARWIREYLTDPKTKTLNYEGFVQNSLIPEGFTKSQFVDFVRQEVALQELERLVQVTGKLVTPQEAESEFRRVNETLSVTLASFPASNFVGSVVLDPAAVGAFYTNRLAEYRIPERAELTYVRFEVTNYLAEAAALMAGRADITNQMEQMYEQRGADAFRDDANNPLSKEAALAKIHEQFQRQIANQFAGSNAVVFANELGQMEPLAAANLATLAARKGLTVQKTPPFPAGARPAGLEDIRDLSTGMSRLAPDQPFTSPMEGARGVVIAAVTDRIPSTVPTLEVIRSRVENDFKEVQAAAAARAAGQGFQSAVAGSLASGKAFADTATPPGAALTELVFTLSTPSITGLDPRVNPAQIKDVASTNKAGTVSAFVPTATGGFVLFVRERKPVDESLTQSTLTAFLAEQREARENDAFSVWFAEQMKKSGIQQLVEGLNL